VREREREREDELVIKIPPMGLRDPKRERVTNTRSRFPFFFVVLIYTRLTTAIGREKIREFCLKEFKMSREKK